MNVFFQRGRSGDNRGYAADLKRTVANALTNQERERLLAALSGHYDLPTHEIFLWGGPSGVKHVAKKMEPGDICLFLLDQAFVYAGRVRFPLTNLSESAAHEVSNIAWLKEDYHHIWVMDRMFQTERVWAADASEYLHLGDAGIIGNAGAVLYHSQVNLNSKPETWFSEHGTDVRTFLRYLGLSADEADQMCGA